MPASPAPADPGWDDDLAWLDRDPMTAQERQASLDRLCEQDEGHREDEADEYGGFEPFTAEELAEIRHAAADELLAVEAATAGRRGPGQPGGRPTAAIAGNSRVTRCWPAGQIPFATWMKSIILAGIVLICGRFGPGR